MSAYKIAETLAAFREEGATVYRDGELSTQEDGYYVGGRFAPLVFDSINEVDRGEIAWWVGQHHSMYYGVWTDSETGKVYVDGVSYFVGKHYALAVGRGRNELAIWDIENGVEIRCNDENERSES